MADTRAGEAMGDGAGGGPHQGQPVRMVEAPLAEARAAVIMLHGRGATAESILTIANHIRNEDVAFLAPQAAANTWYPHSFLSPSEENEPHLSSALAAVAELVARVEEAGVPLGRCMLLGFSQGACLAAEFAARHPRRYGGVVVLSGGLIGPQGTAFDYEGSLDGTPVFLGCSDQDPHIPMARVRDTAKAFHELEAAVTGRIYKGMGHTINEDELNFIDDLLQTMLT